MLLYPPKEIPDGDVVEAVVKQIEITPNKTLYITLINGKRFERYKTLGKEDVECLR